MEYTYNIINVDEAARCMEVVYSAVGHQTMHIGARLPYIGEALEAVIDMYAPTAYWEAQKRQVLIPAVGTSGTITTVAQSNVQEIASPASTVATTLL